MPSRLFSFLRNQHIGLIALFLVLGGGTAYALDGSNTVFSDDIVNGEVKTADIGASEVQSSDIANDQVQSQDIGPNQVRGVDVDESTLKGIDPGSLNGVGSLQAKTVDLQDTTANGTAVSAPLITIGRVPLTAICSNNGGGNLGALIETGETVDGPMLVEGDDVLVLNHDSVDFVLGTSDTVVGGQERSFAITDAGFESASGVAAATFDPATHTCVFTVQALG
jgi:hypothetical protein